MKHIRAEIWKRPVETRIQTCKHMGQKNVTFLSKKARSLLKNRKCGSNL